MSEILTYSNDLFGNIRLVVRDNEPWFVGKDVAEKLGYSNHRKAISDHVDDEDKGVTNCSTPGGSQKTTIINESGLYSLILSSKLPKAKDFKHWVTSEILPSVRKHGGYVAGQEEMSSEELLAKAVLFANSRIQELEEANKKLKSASDYAHKALLAENGIVMSSIAKEYGMSALQMNRILAGLRIQYKRDGQWMLYSQYQNKGYTVTKTNLIETSNGVKAIPETLWTQKGKAFIHKALEKNGFKVVE